MSQRFSRRTLLSLAGAMGAGTLAGCSFTRSSNESETIIFTDSPEPSISETPENTGTAKEPIVFSGGDGQSFASALRELESRPGATLQLESGTYRLNPTTAYQVSSPPKAHFRTTDLENVQIEGNGATLAFTEPRLGGLSIEASQNVTIRNLTLDYDPLPFTQGTITDLSDDHRIVTLELDEEYPSLNATRYDQADVFASVHSSDGSFINGIRARGLPIKRFSTMEQIDDQEWELTLTDESTTRGLQLDRRLAVVARDPPGGSTVLRTTGVEEPTLENIAIRASPGFAMHVLQCSNPKLRNITIAPRPDGDRLISSDADGIHVRNCRGGPVIEDCHIERLLDDGIVVASLTTKVTRVVGESTLEVRQYHGIRPKSGDIFGVMGPDGVRKGTLPQIGSVSSPTTNGSTPPVLDIRFAEPVANRVEPGDYLSNRQTANQEFRIRNNVVKDNRANLIRLAARSGIVEQNELHGSQNQTINIITDTTGTFAPERWSENITIQNNSIRGSGMVYLGGSSPSGIVITHNSEEDVTTAGNPHQGISIADNEFQNLAFRGLTIKDAAHIDIEGNTFEGVNLLDYPNGRVGVQLANISEATLTDNRISGSSEYLASFGRRHESQQISLSNNQFILDGTSKSVEL